MKMGWVFVVLLSQSCGAKVESQRTETIIAAEAAEDSLALIRNIAPAFIAPISVYATGIYRGAGKLDPYLFQSETATAPSAVVLSTPDGKSINVKSTIGLTFKSQAPIYDSSGALVTADTLIGRKVFATGVYDPAQNAILDVLWLQEVPNSIGGCSFESEIFRTRATGCQSTIAAGLPDVVTFVNDESKLYATNLGAQTRDIQQGVATGTKSPFQEVTRLIGVKPIYPTLTFLGAKNCPNAAEAACTPIPPDYAAATCSSLGSGFRALKVSEWATIAASGSLQALFLPYQTSIDLTSGPPNINVLALSASGVPVRYNLKSKIVNDPLTTVFSYLFCGFAGNRAKELPGQFLPVEGRFTKGGRGGFISESKLKTTVILDGKKANDVAAQAQVLNGCVTASDTESGIVLRYDATSRSHYSGVLKLSSNSIYSLVIRRHVGGQIQELAKKDIGYPLGIQTLRHLTTFSDGSTTLDHIEKVPNCQGNLLFAVKGSRLELTMNLDFGKVKGADFNYGGPFTLSATDSSPLPAGFAGMTLTSGVYNAALDPVRFSYVAFGGFRATATDATTITFPPNPPKLDSNPEGSIPLVPGPRFALIDDSSPRGVTLAGKFIGAAAAGFNSTYKVGKNTDGPASATYKFTQLPAGKYLVAGSWVPNNNFSRGAPTTIASDKTAAKTIAIDQRLAPVGVVDGGTSFQSLAIVEVGTGGTVTVTINNSNGTISIDAFRLSKVP
jgi:hypothetical protein